MDKDIENVVKSLQGKTYVSTYSFFVNADTPIHRLAPQTKIILTTLIPVIVFITINFWVNAIAFAVVLIMAIIGKVRVRTLKPFFKVLAFFSVIVVLTTIFAYHGISSYSGPKLWETSWDLLVLTVDVSITEAQLVFLVSFLFRIWTLILIGVVFLATTKQIDIIAGLKKLHVPDLACLIIALALRFMPTLYGNLQTIRDAQISRGAKIQSGNPISRILKFSQLAIPLVGTSLVMVHTISNALDSRAFSIGGKRVYYRVPKMSRIDYFIVFITISAVLLVWVLTLFGWLPLYVPR